MQCIELPIAIEMQALRIFLIVVQLYCYNETHAVSCEGEGSVQLVNGNNNATGRVEVCYNGQWGTVCGDFVSDSNTRNVGRVICKQLGLEDFFKIYSSGFFGDGTGQAWQLDCTGSEDSLTDCAHNNNFCWGSITSIGIMCMNNLVECDEGAVQLVNGNSNATGRVEVCYNGGWGKLCDNNFNLNDANVICTQLGFKGVQQIYQDTELFGEGPIGDFWFGNVGCSGNENSIFDCHHWPYPNCENTIDVGVACSLGCTDGSIQLVDGSIMSGRIEVCYNGRWGTVCDDDFDEDDGLVACRQLGYQDVQSVYGSAYFGEGTGPIWFDELACNGQEESLFSCLHDSTHDCDHYEDAGVMCSNYNECTNGSIQLVDGSNSMSGRIEVCYNGRWGTVCDDDFDSDDGSVACRQLGYQDVQSVYGLAYFGEGTGPIWLDELACNGQEESLFSCLHDSTHDCDHDEDAGVLCFGYASTSDSSVGHTSITSTRHASTTNSIQSATTIKTSTSHASTTNSIQSATTIKTSTSHASTTNSIQSATTIKTSTSHASTTNSIQSATTIKTSTNHASTSIQSATTIKTSTSHASTTNSIQSATTIETTSHASTTNSIIRSATTIKTINTSHASSSMITSIPLATPSRSSDPQFDADAAASSDYHLSTVVIGSVVAVIAMMFFMMFSVITCFIGVYIFQIRKKNRRPVNFVQPIPMDTTFSLPHGSRQQSIQQAFPFELNTSQLCGPPTLPHELPPQPQYANKSNSKNTLKVNKQFSAVDLHKLSGPYNSIQQDHHDSEHQKNMYVQNPAYGRPLRNVGPGKLGPNNNPQYSCVEGENSNSLVGVDVCGEYASVEYSSSYGLDLTRYKINESFMASLIPSIDLKLSEKLGQGEFGIVYKGSLRLKVTNDKIEVAIKTLKGNYTDSEINELIKEAEKMKRFDHPHVLSLIGICVGLLESPCIVMPFMSNGSLLSYLRKEALNLSVPADIADESQRLDVTKQLLSMCSQVAKGMAYLTEQFFVHRDLAARNCMISANGVIKVADFGLAEDVYTTDYFKLDTSSSESMKLPVKWMAVESLHYGKFSEKSDIWSFGVLCWEVFSVGAIPYPGLTAKEVIQTVDSGERLAKPSNSACRFKEYSLMLSCWESRPEDRPDFICVTESINDLLTQLKSYKDFKFQ